MNTSEARRAVSAIAEAEDAVEYSREYTAESLERLGRMASSADGETSAVPEATDTSSSEDADPLKVAEFGLLVGPITEGVQRFLENPEAEFLPGEQCGAREIGQRVGARLYEAAFDALHEDNSLENLTMELALARAQHANNVNHARMLAPLEKSMLSAAGSSAQSMINVALANAYALHQAYGGSLTRAELVATVRNSTQLALAIPMVHLLDLPIVNTILSAHNYGGIMGRGYPDNILRVNPQTGLATNGKPLQEWNIGPAVTIGDLEYKNGDVRVGCPFSFAPKEVRVAYYQAIVDLMDHHMADVWPQSVQ